jgi:hypothetical protein
MNHPPRRYIVPVYTSRGDAEAYLDYPYLHNKMSEWIGWVTPDRQVYSVLGLFVGDLTAEPRIVRRRFTVSLHSRKTPPAPPTRLLVPPTIPLPPMLAEFSFGVIDVLLDKPDLLHTLDAGEARQDVD